MPGAVREGRHSFPGKIWAESFTNLMTESVKNWISICRHCRSPRLLIGLVLAKGRQSLSNWKMLRKCSIWGVRRLEKTKDKQIVLDWQFLSQFLNTSVATQKQLQTLQKRLGMYDYVPIELYLQKEASLSPQAIIFLTPIFNQHSNTTKKTNEYRDSL